MKGGILKNHPFFLVKTLKTDESSSWGRIASFFVFKLRFIPLFSQKTEVSCCPAYSFKICHVNPE
ncbi:hypothetical protein, partial [Bartonella sp. AC53GZZY]|uniref:hypothetical protein n=1 Tax=Bartonella sp. AC53GZZY TaxID=3243456 RepID=UPI0035CFCCBB